MKINYSLATLIVLLMCAACNVSEIKMVNTHNSPTLSFSFENPVVDKAEATKALIYLRDQTYGTDRLRFYFQDESYINLWSSTNTQCFYPLSVGVDTTHFDFDGGGFELSSNSTYYAMYPAQFSNSTYSDVAIDFTGQRQLQNEKTDHLSDYDFQVASALCKDNHAAFSCVRVNALGLLTLTFPGVYKDQTFMSAELISDSLSFVGDAKIDIKKFIAAKDTMEKKLAALTPGDSSATMRIDLGQVDQGIVLPVGDTLRVFFSMFPSNVKDNKIVVRATTKTGKIYESDTLNLGFSIDCNDFISKKFHNQMHWLLSESTKVTVQDEYTFEALDAAVASIAASDTAKLVKNVEIPAAVSVASTQNIIVSLNNCRLSAGSGVTGDWFDVEDGGSLKIEGPGTVLGQDPTAWLTDDYEAVPTMDGSDMVFKVRLKQIATGDTEGYTDAQ